MRVGLPIALILFSSQVAAQQPSNGRESVAAALQAYVQAVRNSDAAGIRGWWADDGVYMAPGSKTAAGRAALDSVVNGLIAAMRVTEITEHNDEIVVDGNIALTRGTYSETLQPRAGGAATTVRGRYLFVWRRQAGGWKIARGMTTDPGEPSAAVK